MPIMAKRRAPAQPSLFGPHGRRRVKVAVDKAIRRGQRDGHLESSLDAGLCAVARTLAEALDETSAAGGDKWLLARLTSELRETLTRLKLDPSARVTDERDELAELVAQLSGSDSG
jgi:hypothetical protein